MALAGSGLIGTAANPLEFGRFLLASAGLHLMLGLAVMTVGLHGRPISEKPLVVRLVNADAPKPLPFTTQPVRAGGTRQAKPRPATEPSGPKEIPRPGLNLPSVGRQEPEPSRAVEMIDSAASDERQEIASQRATEEIVRELGLPSRTPPAGSRVAGGGGTTGPKSVGEPGKVAMVPGPIAGKGFGSGPVSLGGEGEGGGTGPGQTERGGSRQLGTALIAPLTPAMTVGSRRGAGGNGAGVGGNGAAGEKLAAPGYGANPLPKYPPLAREKGYEGTVFLRVLVQASGRVGRLAIDRSSGHDILDRAAVDSVRDWTFLPAQKGGRPVESWVLLPVKFMLN